MEPPSKRKQHDDNGIAADETAAKESSSKEIEWGDDDDDDAYAVASKDLKSHIKWNIKDLHFWWHRADEDKRIVQNWDSVLRKVQELGRRPRFRVGRNGMKLEYAFLMVDRVIKFPQLCRNVQSNDPNTTIIEVVQHNFPSGYARPLGKALRGNTHVSSLTLELETLLPFNLYRGRDESMMATFLKPLLHYIESGPALRKLVLNVTGGWVDAPRHMVNLILRSAAASATLEELRIPRHLLCVEEEIPALCVLLKQTTSLRSLDVKMFMNVHSPEYPSDCENVARALGTNRTLETLTLRPGMRGNSEFVDLILSHLSVHPCLKDCQVRNYHKLLSLPSLPVMLQSSTLQLRSLYLQGCMFNSNIMEGFVLGVKTRRTLEKLVFDGCHLDEDAKAVFLRFVQSTDRNCKLHELGFKTHTPANNGTRFDCSSAGDLAIQLLQSPNTAIGPGRGRGETKHGPHTPVQTNSTGGSIGSLLERLTLDVSDSSSFLAEYANKSSKIRLARLHLGRLKKSGWEALQQHMPSILYLRELSIDLFTDVVSASTLKQVLRRNGNIHVVHINATWRVPLEELTPQTPTEKRLYESLLLRNQHVPKLLASPRLRRNGTSDRGPDRAIDEKNSGSGTAIAVIPPLFQVMAPVEDMQPNTVLMGLLAFKSSFGTATAATKRSLPIVVSSATTAVKPKQSRNTMTGIGDSASGSGDKSAEY
jgi:hypothetical protein